jgi:hypothetical protein
MHPGSVQRPRSPHHLLAFALSLPERILRQLAALLGSLALPLVRLLPAPLRRGKFFHLVVLRQIRLLTDTMGRSELFPATSGPDARALVRQGVGGAVDNLFLLTLHASPVWILLAATDLCAGARSFVHALGEELKEKGVMAEDSRLDRLEDVIAGLSRVCDRASDSLDMPPVSRDQMLEAVRSLRGELEALAGSGLQVADLDRLARQVTSLARDSKRSLVETTAAVAAGTVRTVHQLVAGTVHGTRAALRFASRNAGEILDDYGAAVQALRERGMGGAVRDFLLPLRRSQQSLFAYNFLSGTETVLSFGRWRRAAWRLADPGLAGPPAPGSPVMPAASPR